MKVEAKRIHPVPLLDAAEGDEEIQTRLLNECVSQEISVFVAIPHKMVVQTLGMAGHSGVVANLDDDETYEDSSQPLIDYSSFDSPVIDCRLRFVRLSASDLKQPIELTEVKIGEFTNGGLAPAGMRDRSCYELKDFGRCRVLRHAEDSDPFGQPSAAELTIRLRDLFVDREDVLRIQGGILAALKSEDRWGHRKEAPIVHLIYRAAQNFSDTEYTFKAAKEWLQSNDINGFFVGKGKALDYAARLINRSPNKKSAEAEDGLRLEKITKNETKKDYTESIASNRLRLLHLATDCWVHDRKNLEEKPLLPKGGLWDFLRDLGFKTTEDTKLTGGDGKKKISGNKRECQVAYLEDIIEGGL